MKDYWYKLLLFTAGSILAVSLGIALGNSARGDELVPDSITEERPVVWGAIVEGQIRMNGYAWQRIDHVIGASSKKNCEEMLAVFKTDILTQGLNIVDAQCYIVPTDGA